MFIAIFPANSEESGELPLRSATEVGCEESDPSKYSERSLRGTIQTKPRPELYVKDEGGLGMKTSFEVFTGESTFHIIACDEFARIIEGLAGKGAWIEVMGESIFFPNPGKGFSAIRLSLIKFIAMDLTIKRKELPNDEAKDSAGIADN